MRALSAIVVLSSGINILRVVAFLKKLLGREHCIGKILQ
jgi:hypothetical protein